MTEKTDRDLNAELNRAGTAVVDRVKELVAAGNRRHVVIRNAEGKSMLDLSLTVSVIVAALFLFFFPAGWLFAVLAIILAAAARLRVEIVQVVSDNSDVVDGETINRKK